MIVFVLIVFLRISCCVSYYLNFVVDVLMMFLCVVCVVVVVLRILKTTSR